MPKTFANYKKSNHEWNAGYGEAVIYMSNIRVCCVLFKGLIMDGCVLLTSTPECVVSPRGETTHEGVDVNNTHPSMINPDYNMILANLTLNYQYFAY